MKTLLIAASCALVGTALPSLASAKPPEIHVENGWIVVSYTRVHPQNGPLPWTHAIRKDVITSASIESDFGALNPGGRPPKNFDEATEEQIAELPAVVEIVTNELQHDGGSKRYQIHGLTHGSAPGFLQKILAAVGTAEE